MKVSSPTARLVLIAGAASLMLLLSSLPGSWEVYGAPPPDVTPRGTAPLPPGPKATLTPTPLPPTPNSGPATQPSPPPTGATTKPTPTALETPQGSATPEASTVLPPRSAGSLAQPIPTRISVPVGRETGTQLTSGDGSVAVKVEENPSQAPAQLIYTVTALTLDQLEVASTQGLLTTNLAFDLHFEPALEPSPRLSLSVRYKPQQTAGIETSGLALYRFDPQQKTWAKLEGCTGFPEEERLQCRSQQVGTFLLAGIAPEKGIIGGDRTAAPPPSALWLLAAIGVVAILAGFAVLMRRSGLRSNAPRKG